MALSQYMVKYHKNKKELLFHKTIIYLCNLVSMTNLHPKTIYKSHKNPL